MKRIHSMRWRLQFWYGLLLALVLLGFGLTADRFQREALIRSTDAELERRVSALARSLRNPPVPLGKERPRPPGLEHPPEETDEPPPEMSPPEPPPLPRPAGSHRPLRLPIQEEAGYATDPQGGWYYVIWLHRSAEIIRSANAPAPLTRPPDPPLPARAPSRRAYGSVREAYLPLIPGDLILVGHTMTNDLANLRHGAWLLTGAALCILGLSLMGGRWLVDRSLAPIAAIGEAAARIAGGDLSRRISVGETDSELGQLAEILNATFARLENSFALQARFTADAAHELRTPVTVLLTHTQNALAVRCAAEGHLEAFAACQRAAERMRALIDSLLRLSRLDSGEAATQRVSFDLAHRVREGVELVRPLATDRGIEIRCELNPAPCSGDPEALDQVITNLLTNAIHHNREGGTVRVAVGSKPGGVVLSVTDTGPGIAPQHLPRIFERFYRVDASRSRSSGGTGLGLAIARAIVDAHGGTIEVESEVGRGTCFMVNLPSTSRER